MSLPNSTNIQLVTLAPATSGTVYNLNNSMKRILVANNGANPAILALNNPATLTNGIPLAAGQSITFSVDDWPFVSQANLFGFSTLGTTIAVMQAFIQQ